TDRLMSAWRRRAPAKFLAFKVLLPRSAWNRLQWGQLAPSCTRAISPAFCARTGVAIRLKARTSESCFILGHLWSRKRVLAARTASLRPSCRRQVNVATEAIL